MEHILHYTFCRTYFVEHILQNTSWNTFCGTLCGTHLAEHISRNTFCGTHFTEHILQNIFCGTLRRTHFAEHFVEHILWNTMTKFRCFFPKPSCRLHRCLFRHQLVKKYSFSLVQIQSTVIGIKMKIRIDLGDQKFSSLWILVDDMVLEYRLNFRHEIMCNCYHYFEFLDTLLK